MIRAMGVAGVCAALAWAGERFTFEQLKAKFYYDLGPAEVDVSSYPKEQQANYEAFKRTCSRCHTLARPLNAPIASRKSWRRYVRRMHARSVDWVGDPISEQDTQAIVDFLVYDAAERKLKDEPAFKAKTLELKALFKEVKAERARQRKQARHGRP